MDALPTTLEEDPPAEDVEAVRRGLEEYNRPFAGHHGFRRLNAFVRDAGGAPVAGLLGGTYWGWLYVEILWVREDLRGQGFGGRMLAMAETEAARRGCTGVHLDTMGFQAPAFYRARGYAVYGELPDFVGGQARYYLAKRLDRAAGGEGNAGDVQG